MQTIDIIVPKAWHELTQKQCFFALQKARIERLEENISEQLRLMTAVEYNSKQKRVYSKFLQPPFLGQLLYYYQKSKKPSLQSRPGYAKKVLLYEEHDETPRIQDLRAPVLCNPPVLKTTRRRGPPLDIYIRASLGFR